MKEEKRVKYCTLPISVILKKQEKLERHYKKLKEIRSKR